MDADAGRLGGDEDFSCGRYLKNRPRAEGEMIGAERAGASFIDNCLIIGYWHSLYNIGYRKKESPHWREEGAGFLRWVKAVMPGCF